MVAIIAARLLRNRRDPGGDLMGRRRERRRPEDRTADQIAAALALTRQSDEPWHGLAVWLSHSGMDRDAVLLDRLAAGFLTPTRSSSASPALSLA
jgi:hypothetical protein